ncbi:MAG: thioredoxin [Alphaproteobacteria bacterium]|nr:MAG: thioredoxin [Alphaproteobacteria bacterium]
MKKSFILFILLTAMLFTAGCTEKTQENSTSPQIIQGKSDVIEATQLGQINESLQKGPVLLKLGAEWCGPCQEMKPTLKELAAEYGGRVTVMSVDIDQSPKLADYFEVIVVPDSFVIVGIENGEYVYMQEDGNLSKDRFKARILKLKDKELFERVLDFALQKKVKAK